MDDFVTAVKQHIDLQMWARGGNPGNKPGYS
jgi:hypothetical protein